MRKLCYASVKSEWRRDIWVKPAYVYYRFKLKSRKSYNNNNQKNDNSVNNNKGELGSGSGLEFLKNTVCTNLMSFKTHCT